MAMDRATLAGVLDKPFITDGGIETYHIFKMGWDYPNGEVFKMLESPEGRAALAAYFGHYFAIAKEHGAGLMLDSPTWRANLRWIEDLGYPRDAVGRINRDAIALMLELRAAYEAEGVTCVVSGAIGPRGDGYVVTDAMTIDEAQAFHAHQVDAFAEAGADAAASFTFNYVEEALGMVRAAETAGLPAIVGFTVETDGRLPSGQPLGEAIAQIDAEAPPVYYLINCAHPSHLAPALEGEAPWFGRIGAFRGNASAKSHAELDNSETLDEGDPEALAREYAELRIKLPALRVVGGCCGTDHRHVAAIAKAWVA